ncbi:DUF1993 domain-containing protein [Roseomonas sp. BN140053]|uniref:DUF1993 domain-containing protein n=1 Tax=Roseomonas sp. BN140053 TaxID=3391898 RepID=UPI0039E9A783
MPLSMFQASVPGFRRGLEVLGTLLDKGAAHAEATGMDPAAVVGARLAPDMLTLAGQVQRASDTSKLSAARLSGTEAPRFEDTETTLPELRARVAKTLDYLGGLDPAQFEGSEEREVVVPAGPVRIRFQRADYLLSFALPNFYFHVTTAYDILRHLGVPVGKRDYLGPIGQRE